MSATSTILANGQMLGGYRIEDVIGFGGMAIVYRAEQVSLGRPVALKVLAPRLSNDEGFRERFRREGKHIATLDHPNVVVVHDSGEADGRLYLAMRLVEGATLGERMQRGGLCADETLALLAPIADALDAAHALGLVHRDVKPQNILISNINRPYLADFGVAKGRAAALGLTATGGFIGSVNYASPEQIRGEKTTSAGDVYSLTAVLYQCLTGEVPYPRDTELSIMQAHLKDPPPTLSEFSPRLPALDLVIARGMAKNAPARYSSAGDLLRATARSLAPLSRAQRFAVPAFTAPALAAATSDELVPAAVAEVETADDTIESLDPEATPAAAEFLGAAAPENLVPASPDLPAATEASEHRAQAKAPAATPSSAEPASNLLYSRKTEIVPPHERRAVRASDATAADRRRSAAAAAVETPAGSRSAIIAGGALLAIMLLGIVVALAVAGAGGSSAGRTTFARSGPLTIAYASAWHAAAKGAPTSSFPAAGVVGDMPTFGTNPAIRLTSAHAMLTAGVVRESASIPGGAPPQLVASFGRPRTAANDQVAGGAARVYTWSVSGERMVAYVIPTASADAAIVCQAPGAAGLTACADLASHATLTSVRRLAPGPDTALGHALGQRIAFVLSLRNGLRGLGGSGLTARAPKAQGLADAEKKAASSIARLAPAVRYRQAVASFVSALKREAAAFSVVASDARTNGRSRYARDVSQVVSASKALQVESTTLAVDRLEVPVLRTLRLDGPPALPMPSLPGGGGGQVTSGRSVPNTGGSVPNSGGSGQGGGTTVIVTH